MRYFPFLRGKRYEMIALRDLAENIANDGFVIPIIEPVNSNRTTLKSIERFIEKSMGFLLICNPIYGKFSKRSDLLVGTDIELTLQTYEDWIPTLYLDGKTTTEEFISFVANYCSWELALIYRSKPKKAVLSEISITPVKHHVFLPDSMEASYIESIPRECRVYIQDPFHRQRNADYPREEQLFTDLNTRIGNPDNIDFGDFLIQGDFYSEEGGVAHAVALHHIPFVADSNSLWLTHFVSDRTETPIDRMGKVLEAVDKLVESLEVLQPNNTGACDEYREIHETRNSRDLGPMKGLAIKHHLEVIMSDGALDLKF